MRKEFLVNTTNQFGIPIIMYRKFKKGDLVVCINAENSRLGYYLKQGETYIVSDTTVNHGQPHVYLEGFPRIRLAEYRFIH